VAVFRFTPAVIMLLLAFAPLARSADEAGPGSFRETSFKELAGWKVPEAIYKAGPGRVLKFVPAKLRTLDGQEVAVQGFMLPMKIHNRQVTQFLLMRTQNTCCFGIPPELNEMVEVLRIDNPTKVIMDVPITVVGKLHVHDRWEGTFLCSIYQLDAERIQAPDTP
jgi:hypothetical protein